MPETMIETPKDFWQPIEIEPNTLLKSLRECIIDGPEPPRRTPKWRFRLAADLAIEIQPKDRGRLLFEGRVIEADRITAETFKGPEEVRRGMSQMAFTMVESDGRHWMFKPGRVYRRAYHLRARLLANLESETFKDRAVLLSFHCLICGKGLTDPVSQARLIGPECAGRASIVVPLHLRPVDPPSSENGIAQNVRKSAVDLDGMMCLALYLVYLELEEFEKAYEEFRAGKQTEETFRETLTEFSETFSFGTCELSEYLEKHESLTTVIPCQEALF